MSSLQEISAWLFDTDRERIAVASHRGKFSSSVIENTSLAFSVALGEGADMVELDIARTKDGVLFGHHDKSMARLFRINEPVSAYTWAQLRELPLYNYVGEICVEKLDTLSDILDSLKGRSLIALDRCWDYWEPVYDLLQERNMVEQAIFKFYIENESACRFVERRRDCLFVPMVKDPKTFSTVERLKKTARIPALEILPEAPSDEIFQKKSFDWLHSHGYKIWCNSLSLAKRLVYGAGYDDLKAIRYGGDSSWGVLVEKGVDIIQTDWPYEAKRYLASIGRSLA